MAPFDLAIISDLYPGRKTRRRPSRGLTWPSPSAARWALRLAERHWQLNLGSMLASIVFGLHLESWRWAFYLVVPPGLVLGTLCFFMREPPRGQSDLAEGEKVQGRQVGATIARCCARRPMSFARWAWRR